MSFAKATRRPEAVPRAGACSARWPAGPRANLAVVGALVRFQFPFLGWFHAQVRPPLPAGPYPGWFTASLTREVRLSAASLRLMLVFPFAITF